MARSKEPRLLRLLRVLWVRKRYVFWGVLLGVVLFGVATMQLYLRPEEPMAQHRPWGEIRASGTLRAVTVSSTISAFRYKGKWRGHEYETARRVAADLGLRLEIAFAPSEQAMLDSLFFGRADVALWPVERSVAAGYRGGGPSKPADAWQAQAPDSDALRIARGALGWLRPCGYAYPMGQVYVYDKKTPKARAARLKQGDSTAVRLTLRSASRQALLAQSDSLAVLPWMRPYDVVLLAQDTLTLEQLVARVAEGKAEVTMVAQNVAKVLTSYHTNLSMSAVVEASGDTVSWVVTASSDTLAAKIDSVCRYARQAPVYASITKRYFEQSRGRHVAIKYVLGDGRISIYDDLFRQYAPRCGWDWRMLAAVAYVESRFDPFAESARGARGLMQLMPSTAERYGCPEAMMADPEQSVFAGTNLIADLQRSLRSRIARTKDTTQTDGYNGADTLLRAVVDAELDYYVVGAYNSGLGHIFDAIMLADTLGYDVAKWHGNVEKCLELKADSTYYTNPVVRLGKFPGEVTTSYVREVMDAYRDFCSIAP